MTSYTNDVQAFLSNSFDFIIIGGGTAGLALAARLAAAPAALTVGILEAGNGPDLHLHDDIRIPGHYGRTLGSDLDWCFATIPQEGLAGRSVPWSRGKCLGGSSAINFLTWNRGSREDYDSWEALGNKGWGWDDLLPYFKKSETFHPLSAALGEELHSSHDPTTYGTSGPIQISSGKEHWPSKAPWHRTLNVLGVATNPDPAGGSNVGVWANVNALDPTTATRSYATDYLSRVPREGNLQILVGAQVKKVITENDNQGCIVASGVEFTCQGGHHVVNVTKEVILSAGSVCSPQILEMSGIGNPEVLARAGISVVVDSPRVGENLQEHTVISMAFEMNSQADGEDSLFDPEFAAAARELYDREMKGPLTRLVGAYAFVPLTQTTSAEELTELHDKAASFSSISKEKSDIMRQRLDGTSRLGQVEYVFTAGSHDLSFQRAEGKRYGTIVQVLQYPFSVGSVHISPSGGIDIDPGYFAGPNGTIDLEVMAISARFGASIAATEPFSSIVQRPVWPDSATLADDTKMREWLARATTTIWHSIGTCGMGGSAGVAEGVVDERLRVYGVKGLRVVDASIMPLHISAHPQATVYAIAEKAADMILSDLQT